MSIDLAVLGITKEEAQERVIDGIIDRMLKDRYFDEDGDEVSPKPSSLAKRLEEKFYARVDQAVDAAIQKTVPTDFDAFVEKFKLQKTNEWGQKKQEPVTFVEYITGRVNSYLLDEVDMNGRTQEEARRKGDSWYGAKEIRINRMIDARLTDAINKGIENAFAQTKGVLAGGIEKAVLDHLTKFGETLKAYVSHVPKK